ncbi:hypothetical protein C8F01DRAFT_623038 [Mycena amicta]|nr:hypothetical protein C8F01DRAFT_623038 [Mycena amicta]
MISRKLTLGADRNFDSQRTFEHAEIVSQLRNALPRLTSLHTFVLGSQIEGGLWTELLECLSASPTLATLHLLSSWTSKSLAGPFRLADPLSLPPLQCISYPFPMNSTPGRFGTRIDRRDPYMLEIEGENLRRLTSACHSSLRTIEMPAELLFRTFDPRLNWTSLRELFVSGFWPELARRAPEETTQLRLMSLLEALPNLRSLQLHTSVGRTEPEGRTILVSPEGPLPREPSRFLGHLISFQVASLTKDERILDFLPLGLEMLALTRFPRKDAAKNLRQPILPCVQLQQLLERVDFPCLKTLDIWYRVDTMDDLHAEEKLLESIAHKFPLLENLEIYRIWNHDSPLLQDCWDPVPRFRALLSKLHHLKRFSANLDDPERHRRRQLVERWNPTLQAYIQRLAKLAIDIIELCPSSQLWEVGMYRKVSRDFHFNWERWAVVRFEDGTLHLRSILLRP